MEFVAVGQQPVAPCAQMREHSLQSIGSIHDQSQFDDLGRIELVELWSTTHGRSPPKHLSTKFLRRALAYEIQCKQIGGLSAETRRALRAALKHNGPSNSGSSGPPVLSAGTQLVREWNGRTYRVDVLDNGFRLDGNLYPSISAIARKITGTKWSGPRFFGLVKRKSTSMDVSE